MNRITTSAFLCFWLCAVPCLAQPKETVKPGGAATGAPADARIIRKSGANIVESDKDYTLRRIREFEARIAKLEQQDKETSAALAQIQKTLQSLQSDLSAKTDKPQPSSQK